jgi:methionine-rich copper-binding protein CopC
MTAITDRRGGARHRAAAAIILLAVLALLLRPLFRPPEEIRLSASPGPGAVLVAAPAAVDLHFGGRADAAAAHVTVHRLGGAVVDTGVTVATSDGVSASLPPVGAGWYVVTYHVPLANGAQPAGSYAFAVGRPDGPQPPTVALGGASVDPHTGHRGPVDPLTGAVLAANVVLLIGLGVRLARRRRTR